MLKIYNTLGRELQTFKPLNENLIKVYQCGPTVYNTQHIGNMRAVTIGDLVHRSLLFLGYNVDFARNYTDFGHLVSDADEGEDKMEKGAKREGLSVEEIALKYIQIYDNDVQKLNTLPITFQPRATQYVKEMIEMTQKLLEGGYAYATDEAIYFDVKSFENYTQLSGQKLEENREGAGHGSHDRGNKRNHADFALWFFKTGTHENISQSWESPFSSPLVENGVGTPGWHIECSAMINATLGETIDIHMGGVEHIPVHHTNEIAQSECANEKEFVKYWMHNEHLTIDGEKMAKSAGKSYVLSEIVEKGYSPLHLRYFFLQSHYRSKQNFTYDALDGARSAYENLAAKIVDSAKEAYGDAADVELENLLEVAFEDRFATTKDAGSKAFLDAFTTAIENDFNIPQALAVLWDLQKSDISAESRLKLAIKFDAVLGLELAKEALSMVKYSIETPEITPAVQALLDERAEARNSKNWAKSDEIRDLLKNKFGLIVEDGSEGQKITASTN